MNEPAGTGSGTATRTVELSIGGMTCASCATRVERRLNRLDGVQASVNYATEKASVSYPEGLEPGDLVAAVEATGYTASLPPAPAEPDSDGGTGPAGGLSP